MTAPQVREASPREVRARIDGIPPRVTVPYWADPDDPTQNTYTQVDGSLMKTLDEFLFLSGCRVSEAVTEQTPGEAERGLNNFGKEITLNTPRFKGEDIAVFTLRTLKRRDHLPRTIALPLNQEYEPWTQHILDTWGEHEGNPWNITRGQAYAANHQIFRGLLYEVMGNPEGKPAANHALRHFRIKELIMTYGFTPLEVQRWVGWTAGGMGGVGINPMMDRYFSLSWQDYIQKLLIKRL